MKKALIWIGLGILLVVGAAVTTLFVTGRVAVVVKQPSEIIYTYQKVCSNEVTSAFVSDFKYGEIDTDKINALTGKFKDQEGWRQDPNCVHIMMQAAIANTNTEEAKSLAIVKEELAQKGLYAASDVDSTGVPAEHAGEASEQRKLEPVPSVGI